MLGGGHFAAGIYKGNFETKQTVLYSHYYAHLFRIRN